MVYDEQWLKDCIIEEMNLWDMVDIVRFYENYSVDGAVALYKKCTMRMWGEFYVDIGRDHIDQEFGSEFIIDAPSTVSIESDSVKEELLTSIAMILL